MTAVAVLLIGAGVITVWSGIKGHDVRDVLYAAIKGDDLPEPRYR